MQSVTGGTSIPPNVVIAMAGIAKVFVGEVVEEGKTVLHAGNKSDTFKLAHEKARKK